jgi:hypothetical protein
VANGLLGKAALMSQALDRSLVAVDHLLVEVVAVGARLMVEVVAAVARSLVEVVVAARSVV